MATRRTSRWWDDIGEDPIDRVSRSRVTERKGEVVTRPVVQPGNTQQPAPVTEQRESKKVVSQESGIAPFDTLWHDFDLQALPVYNFWEQNEETDSSTRETQEIVDLPRFVKLTWMQAPDVHDPDLFKKRAMSRGGPGTRSEFIKLSPFGFGANMIVGVNSQGSNFTPPHLQPESFAENVEKCANGFVSSGVVRTVATSPIAAVTTPKNPTSHVIDEDSFLENHHKWWGVSFSELNYSVLRRQSGIVGTQQLFRKGMSKQSQKNSDALVQGQFSVTPFNTSRKGSSMVAAVPSAVSHFGLATESSRLLRKSRVMELAEDDISVYEDTRRNKNVRVNFIHTNFSGLLSQERVDTATQPHQLESTVALAQNSSDLMSYTDAGYQHYTRDISIPYDRAPGNMKSVEYIGYVIEKWEMVDGIYKLVDTFNVPGVEYTSFYDAEVKYGVDYRYRIKGIVRWVRQHGIGVLGKDPTVIDPPGTNIDSMTPNDVSYFHSEWGHEWAHAFVIDRSPPNPPDELVVRPISNYSDDGGKTYKPMVEVTFKLPDNPQRDINKMLLLRKLQDNDGNDLSDWEFVQEFAEDLDDTNRQGTRTSYLTSFEHQQDDITGTKFNVTQSERVERIVEYGPANARYEDTDVSYWSDGTPFRYVYAAVCFSRHDEQSTLSDQIACRLNSDWKKNGELPIDFVSCAGVDADLDVGAFSTYPEKRVRSEFVFRPDSLAEVPAILGISAQERVANKALGNASYVIRVESLDTGQVFDIPLTLTVNNIQEDQQVVQYQNLITVRKESAA